MQTVVLEDIERPGMHIHLDAEVRTDGSIVLSGQDLGSEDERLTGEDEYEYVLTVKAGLAPLVTVALSRDGAERCVQLATGESEVSQLLELLREACASAGFTGTSDSAAFWTSRASPELFSC